MIDQHLIAEFWRWFQSICGQFGERFENQQLIDELDSRIAMLGRFSWELGPGMKNDHNSALALTPSGSPELLEETRKVIDAAPDCPGWEFYPAKPPKKWQRKFVLQNDEGNTIPVDASDARYVLFKYPDGVFDVLLADRSLATLPENLQRTSAEILLDGDLGEERRMALVHNIEIVAQFSEDMQRKSSNIAFLAAHVHDLGNR